MLHFNMGVISDMSRACHPLLPRILAICVWVLYRCLSLVQTVAEVETRSEELEEASDRSKSPQFPHPFSWELNLFHCGLHCSNVCSWPCTWLIQIPALTHGMTSCHDPRSVSSLRALTIGILVWPFLPHPACPRPSPGLWDRQSPAGLYELPLVLQAPGLTGNHWPMQCPNSWCMWSALKVSWDNGSRFQSIHPHSGLQVSK